MYTIQKLVDGVWVDHVSTESAVLAIYYVNYGAKGEWRVLRDGKVLDNA